MDEATYEIVYSTLWGRGMSHADADAAARQAVAQIERVVPLTAAECGAERPGLSKENELSEEWADCCLTPGHGGDHSNGMGHWTALEAAA